MVTIEIAELDAACALSEGQVTALIMAIAMAEQTGASDATLKGLNGLLATQERNLEAAKGFLREAQMAA